MKSVRVFSNHLRAVGSRRKVGFVCATAFSMALLSLGVGAAVDAAQQWQSVGSTDGSAATARHEASGIGIDGKFYLLGGRGTRPVEIYDSASGTWSVAPPAPVDFHHFQAVAIGTDIYAIGALVGNFPAEPSLEDIYVFDTLTETWRIVGSIPEARRRGSAAAAVRDGWIYVIGGNTLGHSGGAVAWFDRYQPSTGTWEILPDAPQARDHHAATWVDDVLVVTGGRRSAMPNVFADTVGATDVWRDGSWSSEADIPTQRAGVMAVPFGSEVLVAGGETARVAVNAVEAFDVVTGQWRRLQGMRSARHSAGGGLIGNQWHVVAGAETRGGSAETNSHEVLALIHETVPDQDEDGLTDAQESELGTDPLVADSDGDGLSDGDEVNEHGTAALSSDTDLDGLDDGEEVQLGSDPLAADTDEDGLVDGRESGLGTNLLSIDSDSDGLGDGDEVDVHGTLPLNVDTDQDGINDGEEVSIGTVPTNADSDADGLEDADELALGTDPLNADTDGDGIADGVDDNPTEAKKRGGGAAGWLLLTGLLVAALRRRNWR